ILQTLHRNLQKRGAYLILCGLNAQPGSLVERSGFVDQLGEGNVAANLTDALLKAQWRSGKDPEVAYA
ncbi:MAG: sodium-independent anion transporter, partial [Proteobacteria bacterium]|nr:sodium-independent anion transporter [Pseudomonadota bacterium]